MSKSKRPEPQVEFFLSKKGIVREVLERETLKYLDDAEIRRAELDGKRGYLITARRAFTKQEHASIKRESVRWQSARGNSRASEASNAGDDEMITGDPKVTRRANHEPWPEVKRNPISDPPQGSAYRGREWDIRPAQNGWHEPLRKSSRDGRNRVSSREAPSVSEHASTATLHSSDGVKPYNGRQGTRYLSEKRPEERHQVVEGEIVVPAIGGLSINDFRAREPRNDLGRQRHDSLTRPSYRMSIENDREKRYTLQDEEIDFNTGDSENRQRNTDRYRDTQPRRSSFYEDRQMRKGARRVLIDDLDSVTGTQHVIRDPKEPLSTRSQSLKQSERSRRIREIGQKEAADEQATFRRQRSIEHLDLVEENDEEHEVKEQTDMRRTRHPRERYEGT